MSNATADSTLTPAQAEATRDAGIHSLNVVHNLVTALAATLNDDQFFTAPCAGGNHTLWNIGHLAMANASFMQMAGGTTEHWKEEWRPLFEMGSEPTDDRSVYPSPKEIVAAYDGIHADYVAFFKGLSGEALAKGTGVDGFAEVAPTIAHLPGFSTLHDSVHAGQITACRKAMGLDRVMA